jgi:hypothetical protein
LRTIGLCQAGVLRGSHITMEQTRVDDRIWMPARVEVGVATKIFFVKTFVIDRVLAYSEYRLVEAGVSTGRDPVETTPWTGDVKQRLVAIAESLTVAPIPKFF